MTMAWGNRTRFLVVGAALAALAAGACSDKSDDESNKANADVTARVTITHVTRADISQTISLTGTAVALPNEDVRVSSLVAGRVAELTVAEGDSVKSGEVLAKIDDRTYHSQLQQAEAAVQQAQANLDNAKQVRTRNEDLFKRGIVAQKEVENSRTQENVADATLQQAKAALDVARLQVVRSQIVSPLSGSVAKRFVSVGEQVDGTAAQPIVEVANLREVEFLASAPAEYLSKMHQGESVDVTTTAMEGQKFPGRVVAISPAVDPATGVGTVRIRVPNPNGLLRLGIFLSAAISVNTHRQALTVPPEAIYRDESGAPRVFAVNQDSATAVPVKIGIETKDRVEIEDASGVKEGDSIILSGGYGLGDKARVQIQPQSSP